ncbi:MAG: glycosyltransferase family 4 protein [Fibrobacter sp.]|uniref:glycosyltransferase family 4 protein n=1 Tax=Fibrobacter sp. TaxID=35828 RepID=UPI0025B967E2|nr:glycosyltransferase family 1 protein [Fibrobacter sp.]MBR4785326.1 glycosyltransferase family 4 protein [Fibrobacter sp.]
MRRIKILFDVTQLVRGIIDTRSRGGVFFVAQNILRELSKRLDVDVILLPTVIDSVDLFYLREKNFYSLKMFEKPSSLDFAFYKLRKNLKYARKIFSRISIIRKCLYVIIRFVEILHLCIRKYNFSKYSPSDCVYFSPNQAPPKELKKTAIKSYVVLHDIIPILLEEYKEQSRTGWFKTLIDSFNDQDAYFAVSNATKKDFLAYFPILKSEQLHVLSLAASEKYKVEKDEAKLNSVKEKYGIPKEKKYLFSLCTLEPRKNQIRAVSCFLRFVNKNQLDDIIFVLGGGAGTTIAQKMKSEIESVGNGSVLPIGFVDDVDLPILYGNAEWFVFTSQYEGFGLPPLEAMQCGCPVITSNNSSLPEVVGDAGIMIDWDSDEQHIDAYEKYYFNEALRKENRRKGLERAKLFSWKKTTEEIVAFIESGF